MKPELADSHAAPASCLNCNATVSGNYCHNCGQETRTHAPSLAEFAHEFIGHYVALEGRLWGTFTRLLFRPGALTNEYLAGRRKRYVEPLRLYLTLSILFFALLKFTHTEVINLGDDHPQVEEAAERAQAVGKERGSKILSKAKVKDSYGTVVALDDDMRARLPGLAERIDHFDSLPREAKSKALSDGFFHYGPYAMFALMPLFALYLKMLYLGSGRRYGEHLLFALHVSSFAFVMFAAIKISDHSFLNLVLLCWLVGYLPWAMKRVYGGGKLATVARWSVLMLAHGISLSLAIAGAMMAGAASGH
ncbi:DUF3667 domain-containing protein [Pseudoduganella aquatica]|uniref:DUF3667 domain-containing protein n=1 Tax=Pseudoduganella aquatica TaxID=2660641 RepID=UPI001E51AA8A|nr:DUF3667 domain-containing protein [Pseudoduganella aquatica]